VLKKFIEYCSEDFQVLETKHEMQRKNTEIWTMRAKTFESYRDTAEMWEQKYRDLEEKIHKYKRFVDWTFIHSNSSLFLSSVQE